MDFAAEVKFFEYCDKVANAAICLSRLAILMMWSCWLKMLRRKMSMMIMDVFGCDYVIRRAAANGDGALCSDFWECSTEAGCFIL